MLFLETRFYKFLILSNIKTMLDDPLNQNVNKNNSEVPQ